MRFSPKLKKAISEIKRILVEYDIAAVVVLHTEQHGGFYSEYLFRINPSDSCVSINDGLIRIQANAGDHRILHTSNMLRMLAETTANCSMQLFKISEKVDEVTGAKHDDGLFTPDDFFNN